MNRAGAGSMGAAGELFVAADLLRQGREVYRAVSPSASCDIAVLVGARVLRVEVRTGHCAGSRTLPTCHWDDFDRGKGADVVHHPLAVTYLDPTTGRSPAKMREYCWVP